MLQKETEKTQRIVTFFLIDRMDGRGSVFGGGDQLIVLLFVGMILMNISAAYRKY